LGVIGPISQTLESIGSTLAVGLAAPAGAAAAKPNASTTASRAKAFIDPLPA
jgi:hypothetical protein